MSCDDGYFLGSDNKCKICTSELILVGCEICSSSSICTDCEDGFFLDNSVCELCNQSIGCITCTDLSHCSNCDDGYFLDTNN